MRKKISFGVSMLLCLSMLSGCGEAIVVDEGRNIELVEPVGSAVSLETVQRRNLYEAVTYEAAVYPYVEEYAYEDNYRFSSYEALPGETVKKGDILMYAYKDGMDEQIESMESRLQKLKEDYEEYCKKTEEKLVELRDEMEVAEWAMGNLELEKPEQYTTNSNGQQEVNSAYSNWERDYGSWLGQANKAELTIEMTEVEKQQKKELYELDYAFYTKQLNKLMAEKEKTVLRSQMDGQVVAIQQLYTRNSISLGEPVIAVADMSRKYIKCEYIRPRSIEDAYEVYAFINGKRYELTYEESEDTTRSIFLIHDENNEISVGEFAVLVFATNGAKQALTLSNEAIHQDTTKKYVYVEENGEVTTKEIRTGMSDGKFTEILFGLEEGDKVVVSDEYVPGANTAVLESETFSRAYAYTGNMYYPDRLYQYCEMEYVTVRYLETLVNANQYVEEGTPIIKVSVEGDPRALEEKETELQREKERLADLIAQNNEANAEKIASWQEDIAQMEEELNKMRKEYSTTEIVAQRSGQIKRVRNFEANEIITEYMYSAEIADVNTGYLIAESRGFINYGTEVEITFTTTEDKPGRCVGKVVTLGDYGVSEVFSSEGVLIQFPDGVLQTVKEYTPMQKSGTFRINKINVHADAKVMENVVHVPADAVKEENGKTYVDVILEDGTVTTVPFLSGGSTRSVHWVIDGLDEGMTVCW